jgi:putative protein-disulfide isomerase
MKLYYIYDALCGWCYGFSPVMKDFHDKYHNDISFEVISGGMVTGDRIGSIGQVAGYIRQAYKDVEERTGVKFGQDFLQGIMERGTAVFTSLPPAKAMTAFKHFLPDQQVPFAHALQYAIYFDGMEPENLEGYVSLASNFGINKADYARRLQAEDNAYATREEFMFTQQLGVQGFPMVILKNDQEKYYLVSRGYVDRATLEEQYTKTVKAAGTD